MLKAILILALLAVGIPVAAILYVYVHVALENVCIAHARRYCKRHGLTVRRFRWELEFTPAAGGRHIKTESTLVQIDCLDAAGKRRLLTLLVWPFGVRKLISNEEYPTALDEPESSSEG